MKKKKIVNEEIGLGTKLIFGYTYALFALFAFILMYILSSKIDEELSKKVSQICNRQIKIRKLKAKFANAMSFLNFIFITSRCYEILDENEIIAVCLHEVGHHTTHDSFKKLATNFSIIGIAVSIREKVFSSLSKSAKTLQDINSASLIALGILFFSIYIPKIYIAITIGRKREYNADKFATKYGYGKYLISSLNKLNKDRPEPNIISKYIRELSKMVDEHPELKERTKAILKDDRLINKKGKIDNKQLKNIIDSHAKELKAA